MTNINLLTYVLIFLIAIEHIGICFLEMFGQAEVQAKAFDMETSFTKQPTARISLANQGIYNGMLGVIIVAAYFIFKPVILVKIWALLLIFIVVVAIYGGFTAAKKIFVIQLLPALIALILLLV